MKAEVSKTSRNYCVEVNKRKSRRLKEGEKVNGLDLKPPKKVCFLSSPGVLAHINY